MNEKFSLIGQKVVEHFHTKEEIKNIEDINDFCPSLYEDISEDELDNYIITESFLSDNRIQIHKKIDIINYFESFDNFYDIKTFKKLNVKLSLQIDNEIIFHSESCNFDCDFISITDFINKYYKDYQCYKLENLGIKNVISCEWLVGGMTGGNCYGDEPYPVSVESEPDFTDLYKILKEYTPSISVLKLREVHSLINFKDNHEGCYYGNSYDYKIKYVYLSDLYDFILENR